MIAARVAAALGKNGECRVTMKSGGLGEIRVTVDGRDAFVASHWGYPSPTKIVATVEKAMQGG